MGIIAFFELAKFSFARLRQDHVAELTNISEENRKFISSLYEKPTRFINTAQFYIIFLIFLISYWAIDLVSELNAVLSYNFSMVSDELYGFTFIALYMILVLLVLFLGEVIPKALGLSFPERYISFGARVVYLAGRFIFPLIWCVEKLSNFWLKPLETKFVTEMDLVHTEEEIRMLVNRSHLGGTIDSMESELIDNVFDFVERLAKEVMVPRQDMVCLYIEDEFEDNMKIIRESRHSRYPLCMEDKDHILGLVHVKDIMDQQELGPVDLRNIRRDILMVPEVMKVSNLLQYMRKKRTYLAIVVDEYGGTVGMVGLEDILAELVGDIHDENETKQESIVELGKGIYEFDGKVLLDEVEDVLDAEISDVDEDTIGGFVFGLLERTPEIGDTVVSNGYIFTVLEVQGYRITRVKAEPQNEMVCEGEQ